MRVSPRRTTRSPSRSSKRLVVWAKAEDASSRKSKRERGVNRSMMGMRILLRGALSGQAIIKQSGHVSENKTKIERASKRFQRFSADGVRTGKSPNP